MDHDKNSLGWLLDLLVGLFFFVAAFVVIGYGMDLSAGAERNELMDRFIIVAALGTFFLGSIWYFRK